jgi:hypothetical protein
MLTFVVPWSARSKIEPPVPELDCVAFTRAKIEPMIRGLFRRPEQDTLLAALARSIVFLTSANIEQIRRAPGFHNLAWADTRCRADLLGAARALESESSVLGVSAHLLVVART